MPERTHTLARLAGRSAPMPPRRAAAVMVAVAEEVVRVEAGGTAIGPLSAREVALGPDGAVTLSTTTPAATPDAPAIAPSPEPPGPSAGGASLGRLFFELLVGRPPLGRADAHEPALTDALEPELCALLARSFADAPGQWPDAETWADAFADLAGPLAPPPPPGLVRRERRRRAVAAVALALLAAITVVVVLAAPRWWDATSESSGPSGCPASGTAAPGYCDRASS